MQIQIKAPSSIYTSVQLPASKSISNRVLLIGALAGGSPLPGNLSDCDDTQVMLKALLQNGEEEVDVMAAGTAMRFLTAYFSVLPGKRLLTGSERMRQRPVSVLVDALREWGADIVYAENEGYPPLHLKGGRLKSKPITLQGNVSSQYVSALLMIGPLLEGGIELHLSGEIISKPYIDLTLELMKAFGAEAGWSTEKKLFVSGSRYKSVSFAVENDWSSASYWYQIVSLSADACVELPGLSAHSIQGDSKVSLLFDQLGVDTLYTNSGVQLRKSREKTSRFDYDFTDQPDLVQTLAVTCALKGIPFRFSGLQSLRIKETDRISALMAEMNKLGYVLKAADNAVLSWDGQRSVPCYQMGIDTYQDHRMAMAFAPASLIYSGLTINNPEVVSKSYPRYWENLTSAGFVITQLFVSTQQANEIK